MLNIKEYLHRIDIFKDRDESTIDFEIVKCEGSPFS